MRIKICSPGLTAALLLFGFSLDTAPAAERAATRLPLELEPGERVVLIGNTLFDRARDYGFFETLLHQKFPRHSLIVRNLAWSADEITLHPRPDEFGNLREHLRKQKADTIIAAYGFNESFRGIEHVVHFKHHLAAFLAEIRNERYNGRSFPRVVFVSPIAFENLGAPLPDGKSENAALRAYTAAMKQVAANEGAGFVDVFTPTHRAMSDAGKPEPFTFNGIHLEERGYRMLARALYRGLFDEAPPAFNERIREVVVDKSHKFFRRYRTLNAYYIHGGRKNPYGVVNFPNEMKKWDQLIANRDRRIHDLAAGRSVPGEIDDSNTIELPSITGDRPGAEWMTPEDEKKSFLLDPRFEIDCFASEQDFPELACPIQMRWDARGRLWVACSTSYPQVLPGQEPDDRIIVLEDTDQDGRADTSEVFATGLHIPLSFEFGDGGLYVSEQPHLTFLKDTDGDGKADFRRKVLTGFGTEDSHHALHDFTWTPEGDLIFRESIFHHSQIETPYGPVRVRESGFFVFRPREHRLIPMGSYRSTNPWGLTFDQWGWHLGSHPVFASAVHARNAPYPEIHAPAGNYFPAYSGTCGQEFVYNDHFPGELQGGFIRVRYKPTHEVEIHKWIQKDSHYEEEKQQPSLLQAQNLSFIPVDVRFGPRGALYICDWYNPIKGHMQYSLRDTRRDKTSGRIWRVTAKGRPLLDPPRIAGQPIPKLLDLLKRYEYRHRYRAKRELRERDPAKVKSALDPWVAQLDPQDPHYDRHRVEALWMYRNVDATHLELLEDLAQSGNPNARAAAARMLRWWHPELPEPIEPLERACSDVSGLVRLEGAIAGSYYGTREAAETILSIRNYPMDNYLTYALRSSLTALKPAWILDQEWQKQHPGAREVVDAPIPSGKKRRKGRGTPKKDPFDRHNPRIVRMETVPERMLFTLSEFTVKAGEAVKLILDNPDATPHNLVICKPGTADKIGMAAMEMAKIPGAFEKMDFLPKSDDVLHATEMLQPLQGDTLRFFAPKKPGTYPYVCTFPGHYLVMRGVMIVE